MLAAGLSALFAYRGLYGQIPLLLAMGMAAITAYLAIKFLHLLRSANVKMQNVQFKRGRRVTRAGWTFAATAVAVFAFTLHSLAVQYNLWRGRVLSASADLDDEVWLPGNVWWEKASFKQHAAVHSAIAHIERAEAWGFLSTPAALHDLVRLQLAEGDVAAAERTARRLADLIPDQPQPHLSLGGVLRRTDRFSEAEAAYRTAIRIDPTCSPARRELGALLGEQRRFDDAVALYREGMETHSSDAQWRTELVRSLMAAGRFAEAKTDLLAMIESDGESGASLAQLGVAELQTADIEHGLKHLRRALELDPSMTEARYNLAVALLALRQVPDATALLERVVTENPTMAQARYNLAVAVFMSGRPADALPQVREALRLAPDDLQARGFLSLILEQLNSSPGIAPSGASVSPD